MTSVRGQNNQNPSLSQGRTDLCYSHPSSSQEDEEEEGFGFFFFFGIWCGGEERRK